jgi:DNA-binding transcriptional LysR family regulator
MRLAQLRLRDLMLLEHLHDLGSITEVAGRMHVTQSAISQALRSMEQAFDCQLVTRGRPGQRGVGLSPAGLAALRHLRVARHELMAAHAAVAHPDNLLLRIGALPLALVHPLPEMLAQLRRRLAHVNVELVEDTVSGLWRQLESGEADAVVCRLPALTEHLRLPSDVAHRTIGHEPLVLVCAKDHPVARRRKLEPTMLLEFDWVLPPEGSYTRLLIEQWFLRAGLKGPRVVVTSMSFHANLRLAAQGNLLAVAPHAPAHEMRQVLGLVLLKVDWAHDDDVTLLWRKASLENPALVALLDCVPARRLA